MLTKSGRWRKYNMTFQIFPHTTPSTLSRPISQALKRYKCIFSSSSRPTAHSFLVSLVRGEWWKFKLRFLDFGWLAINVFNPFLRCLFYSFPSRPMSSCMEKQTTVHQILSENAIQENIFSFHILTNENPFSFCLRKSFRCPSTQNPLASPFFPFGIYSINTHRLSSARTANPFFGSFVFRIETNFPAKQSSSNKNPPRIHNHLFSRKLKSSGPSSHLYAWAMTVNRSILQVLVKRKSRGAIWCFLEASHLDGNL